MGKFVAARKVRMVPGVDDTVNDWLQQYADRVRLNDVMRLALWFVAGFTPDDLPDDLYATLGLLQHDPTQAGQGVAVKDNGLANVLSRMVDTQDRTNDILEGLPDAFAAANPTHRPSNATITSGRDTSRATEGSGIDMSAPKPRKRLPRKPSTSPEDLPELTDEEKVMYAKRMAQSIFNFNPNRTDGTQ